VLKPIVRQSLYILQTGVEMKLTCSIDEIRRLGPEGVKEIQDNDKSGEF